MNSKKAILIISSLFLASLSCVLSNNQSTTAPRTTLGPPPSNELKVILQRLEVNYLGLDGHKVIGSGCPGNDGRGSIENYHFIVQGVDKDREVTRILVAGDNSTLTWGWPCNENWGLLAQNLDDGVWEIFIAPSSPTQMYTILFFYDDNVMAMGMINTK